MAPIEAGDSRSIEVIMRQEAGYPHALKSLVERVRYKQGWAFRLADMDRGQGSMGLTLTITLEGPDSYEPHRVIRVLHQMIVPAAAYDERSWCRWLLEQILLVERHETCEFFMIGDVRPYAPNHGEGHDPYTIFDQGFKEDVEVDFRGQRTERKING